MTTQPAPKQLEPNPSTSARLPVIFAAHGAPMLLDDAAWMAEFGAWAKGMPTPKSILVISAHWDARPLAIGATDTIPLVYDFYGFPQKYYATTYRSPGAPALARRVRDLLREKSIPFVDEPKRGLDHGAYIPLLGMYPEAKIPVLQISLPGLDEKRLFDLGTALAPLRGEGVLIFGSGFLTHNMSYAFRPGGVPAWASEFDAWAESALRTFDVDALINFKKKAPSSGIALPTWEHYAPVIVAAGAAGPEKPSVTFPISGFWMNGAFTRRSVMFA